MIRTFLHGCFCLCTVALLWGTPRAYAQSENRLSTDEAAVRQARKDYLEARQRGDIKAMADFWTADGTLTDDTGKTVKMQDLLAKTITNKTKSGNNGSNLAAQTKSSDVVVRFITPNVADEEGNCETMTAADSSPIQGHYSAIWVKQDGRWKLNSLHEMQSPSAPATNPLASLDIFAGQWTGEINKSTIKVSASWDATKKFLRREFSIASGPASLGGTQEIGWDPVTHHIKSWTFLTDGSHGDGLWSLEGNVWMEASARVLPDGKTSTSTQIYEFPDRNTMIWKTIRGSIDGQPTDDFEVVFKRLPSTK